MSDGCRGCLRNLGLVNCRTLPRNFQNSAPVGKNSGPLFPPIRNLQVRGAFARLPQWAQPRIARFYGWRAADARLLLGVLPDEPILQTSRNEPTGGIKLPTKR